VHAGPCTRRVPFLVAQVPVDRLVPAPLLAAAQAFRRVPASVRVLVERPAFRTREAHRRPVCVQLVRARDVEASATRR
jgi:hypothetical protein